MNVIIKIKLIANSRLPSNCDIEKSIGQFWQIFTRVTKNLSPSVALSELIQNGAQIVQI